MLNLMTHGPQSKISEMLSSSTYFTDVDSWPEPESDLKE
jgi:hypothetical protein